MGCNCKNINNVNDINNEILNSFESEKMPFFKKIFVIYSFLEFNFYFVITSILNLLINDKLEPKIPNRLINKYRKYG